MFKSTGDSWSKAGNLYERFEDFSAGNRAEWTSLMILTRATKPTNSPPACQVCEEAISADGDPHLAGRTLPCGHTVHLACLGAAASSSRFKACPVCKKPIDDVSVEAAAAVAAEALQPAAALIPLLEALKVNLL